MARWLDGLVARGFDKKDFPEDWRNGSSDVIVETKA